MPIRAKRECSCRRCGRKFTVETGDAITLKDLKRMNYCLLCRIITTFSLKQWK